MSNDPFSNTPVDVDKYFKRIDVLVADAPDIEPVIEPYLYKYCVTMVIGDPGVGKTTLSYNLALTINNAPFLNMKAAVPVKSCILDFESCAGLIKNKYNNLCITGEPDIDNCIILAHNDKSLSELENEGYLQCAYDTLPFNLLIIDNLGCAFSVKDENDNAEAIARLKFIRMLANKYKCAVLVFHHPSKGNSAGIRKGSGAFAYARYAEVIVNMNEMPAPDDDIVELEMPKNRMQEDKPTVYYRKCGYGDVEICDPPVNENIEVKVNRTYPIDQLCNYLLTMTGTWQHKELVALSIKRGYSDALARKAILRLSHTNKIKPGLEYGTYKVGE